MAEPAGGRAAAGRRGEAAAALYYQKQGCTLLAHNYRTRLGELDLVLLEGGTLVFAEVKTRARRSSGWGAPGEAVGPNKRRRLLLAARQYLRTSPYRELPVRFDVVEVTPAPGGGLLVHCIRGAFEDG